MSEEEEKKGGWIARLCCLPRLPPIKRETLTDLDNLLDHEIPKVHHEVARYTSNIALNVWEGKKTILVGESKR